MSLAPGAAPLDQALRQTTNQLSQALENIVGPAYVLPGGQHPAYERDWRGRYHGQALFIVSPANTAEVAAVVRCCAQAGVAMVPQGGNTGLVGASVPDGSGQQVLISLKRLRQIRQVDGANLSITVEAGCLLHEVQQAAQAAGYLFPLSLASEGSCTIGGNLASNAGGTQVLRYGNARELCLGLEVVTASGQCWSGLSGLRKDNTGYALRDLFIGSEGTLGIITAATLKLFPLPRSVFTGLAAAPSAEAAQQFLDLARQHFDAGLTAFELISDVALQLVRRHLPQLPDPLGPAPWTVLWELSLPQAEAAARPQVEAWLLEALERGAISNSVLASSGAQAQMLWQLREAISPAQQAQGLNIKHDVAVPVSAIPGFIERTGRALQNLIPGVQLVTFGHMGDGNLHYNVQAPAGMPAAEFLARWEKPVNRLVHDAVQACGGSISAEHGIGVLKREELARRKDPVALGLMRNIKAALDPANLMNPGRLL